MKSSILFRSALLCAALCLTAAAGTIFLPAYPANVLVIDESTQKILENVPTEIGLPTGAYLSYDRKKIYLTTQDHNGIAVLDIATRKIINHFELNSGNRQLRFRRIAPDPEDKVVYTVVTEADKLPDRFEIGKPKYAVIDLAQHKIIRTVDMEPDDRGPNQGFGRGGMMVSPDGKYLYQFRNEVVVMNTSDFKVIDRINLAKPDFSGMTDINLGRYLENYQQSGYYTSLFYSEDPIVHRRIFGIARFNLNMRRFTFSPIGPTVSGMDEPEEGGFMISPDGKHGYTPVITGQHGTKMCEFWAFDLANNRRTLAEPWDCLTHFNTDLSSDGKEIYVSGSGFQIAIYDAATLKLKSITDLHNDTTMAGMIVVR
ncbi:MAG TPA: hypothetical protein VH640_06510 [Bryobacteraceae bacterium]|jgi:DNA-binding beta-propeller fold protein YncE